MRKIVNTISGIIFGLSPLAGATIIGITIYASLQTVTVLIIYGLLGVLSIWLGLKIFKKVQIVGPIEFMTTIHASPELDNLEPSKNSETKRRSLEEFVELIKNKQNLCKGGTFRIFNDWFGKPYDNFHKIESAEFNKESKCLTLNFNEGEQLEIYNPIDIFEASTFLKVVKADRIKLTWFYYGKAQTKKNQYFLNYRLKDEKIMTDTDVDWYKPIFNVSIGNPALVIFG